MCDGGDAFLTDYLLGLEGNMEELRANMDRSRQLTRKGVDLVALSRERWFNHARVCFECRAARMDMLAQAGHLQYLLEGT